MKLFSQRNLIAAALATAFVGLSATAIAQNTGTGATIPPELHAQHMAQRGIRGAALDPARVAEMEKNMAERHAARQAKLKTELKITTSQEAAWTAYLAGTAHAPRQPVAAEDWSALTTPQRLDKMQAHKAQRDAEMTQRIDATRRLYAALTPEQQKTFDAQNHGFQRAGMQGGHHKGGHGGRHGAGNGMGCDGSEGAEKSAPRG